jgi:hypothetical protein
MAINAVKHKKRAARIAYKALTIFAVVLSSAFLTTEAAADTGYLNYTPAATSSDAFTGYIGQAVTLPELTDAKYAGDWKTGTCAAAVYVFTFDIMASTSLDILGSRHASYGSGSVAADGSCRYTIGAVRTGANYPGGTLVSTTTGIYLPAGNYWLLFTKGGSDYFAGVTSPAGAQKYKHTVATGWLGAYDIGTVSFYFSSSTITPPPASTTPINTTTRIVDFAPADGATLPADPVTFSLHGYVSPDDIGTFIGVRFSLEKIDQNVLLFTSFSPASSFLLDGFDATTSGDFFFTSEPQALAQGNYMVSATLERSYFGGWVVNPFSPITETLTHQFVVGSSTFIGNLQQEAFRQAQDYFASSTATSTLATAGDCNPLKFSTLDCLAYLFVPSRADMQNTILGLKDNILTRVPWGYVTRFATILSSGATSALPSFEVSLHLGPGSGVAATDTLAFDPGDMLAGGALLAGSITDVTYGKTAREITEPFVQGGIALLVLFIIVGDILGGTMAGDSGGGGSSSGRSAYSRQKSATKKEYTF